MRRCSKSRLTVVEVPVGRIVEEFLEEGIAEWEGAGLGLAIGIGLLLHRQLDSCGDHDDLVEGEWW